MEIVVRPPMLPEEKKLFMKMAREHGRRDVGLTQMSACEFERLAIVLTNFSDNVRRGAAQLLEVTSTSDCAARPQDPVMANALVTLVNSGHPAFISFTGPDKNGMHTATLHAVIA